MIKPKSCVVCGKQYQPTGMNSKYCCVVCKKTVWTTKVLSAATYAWQVKNGVIKQPGVGTGRGQGSGPTHHSFKPDAPNRYRDYLKVACERCGSTKFLCGHHKDHDHSNNDKENIETLCKKCHQTEHKHHKNFMSGFNEARRQKLSDNLTKLNKTLPRSGGRNSKVL